MFRTIFLFTILLLASVSCRKETDDYYWGSACGRFNNATWEAKPSSVANKPYGQGIDFILTRFNDRGSQRENLYFYKIPYELGKHRLSVTDIRNIDSLSGASFYAVNDDVLLESYTLQEGVVDNYLEITRIEGDQIWAEFQVAFLRTGTPGEGSYPDRVVFTRGEIHTRVQD